MSFAGNIETILCKEDGSTDIVTFSEGVTMVGATTDAGFGNLAGNFLTGFTGGVWGAVSDVQGPIDDAGTRVTLSTLSTQTRPLVLVDYGFNIPCNATITDININVTRRNALNEDVVDGEIRLRLPNFSTSSLNLASATPWLESTTAWETVSYNDATWGESITPEMLNDPRFGVWIIASKPGNTESARPEIDAIEIEVCYDVAGTAFEQIELAINKANSTCGLVNGQIAITAQNGSGLYEYSIDNGATWTTNATFSGLTPGSYQVTVRNTDMTCQTTNFNCLVGVNETILQPGDAIGACDPFGTPVTLYVERLAPIHNFYTGGFIGSDISDFIEAEPFTWTTGDLGGEVFSVTTDADLNIYTGTTSLYSPTTTSPTVISKIDAMTGVASVLATLPGDKGIATVEFDDNCGQLFASNLEDGVIYRVDGDTGATLSTFDPLGADTGVPGFEPVGERILGMAYSPVENRLYYAVWANDQADNGNRNTVRSIAIDPTTCDFLPATDVEEIQLPFLSEACGDAADTYSMPIADIEISASGGTILLAESGINSITNVRIPHKARILEYDGSTGAWVLDNTPDPNTTNGCKYGIGDFREQNNARGGVDFANAGFDAMGCITGEEDFLAATVDGVFGVNCLESCVYGVQYVSTNGGGPFQSVGMDIDRDNNSQLKSIYGDVDMIGGCLQSDPMLCLEYDLAISSTLITSGTVEPGDIITVEYTIVNEGTMDATNVGVTGTLPTGFTHDSSTADTNVTDNGDNSFVIASLPVGATQVIEVMIMVPAGATAGSFDLFTEISTDDGDDIDSDPATNYTIDEDGDGDPFDDDEDVVAVLITILDYDLSLNKTLVGTGPYNPGDNVSFIITVTNEGDVPSGSVTVTDQSPAALTFQGMTLVAGVTDNGDETFTIANIPVGGNQAFEVNYQIDAAATGVSIGNLALITEDSGDDIDSDPDMDETEDEDGDGNGDDDDEDTSNIPLTILDYDLSINKTLVGLGPYNPGNNVSFIITVTNEGELPSGMVTVTDVSPASLIFQGMTPVTGVTDNGNETFTITNIPVGSSQAFEVNYQIDAAATGVSIGNLALITEDSGDDIDSDPMMDETEDEDGDGDGDDDDEDTSNIPLTILDYDLSLNKTLVGTGPYNPGNNVSFIITVTNEGELPSGIVTVTDVSPASLIFQGMTPVGGVTDNGNETFTIANIPVGSNQAFEVNYQISTTATGTSIGNLALITSDNGDDIDSDPDMDETQDEDGDGNGDDDDEDTSNIPLTILDYDLALMIDLISMGPFNPGNSVTYTVTVTNQGDLDATNAIITTVPDSGLTFVSMTPTTDVADNGNETYTLSNIPVGGTQTFDVIYNIDPTFTGSALDLVALITTDDGDDIDSNPATDETVDEDGDGNPFDDDEDIETIPVTLLDYDLSLTKTLNGMAPFNPGTEVTFTITVSNDGELVANDVVVTDSAPAALIFQNMTGAAGVTDNGDESFTIASIAVGASQSFDVTYLIDPNFTGMILTNLAQITEDDGDDIDSDPMMDETQDEDGDGDPFDDDEDEVDVPVVIPPYDLALTKTLASTGPFLPGDNVTYTITVDNEGAVAANGIVVTDESPAGLIFQGMSPNGNVTDNADETFTIGSVVTGSGVSFDVTYQIDPNFTGTSLINMAQITADDGDDLDSDPDLDETVDENGDGNPVDDDEDMQMIDVTPIFAPGSVGDFVWEDLNGNGSQDPGEAGLQGIEVILHNANGVIVGTQFTDSNGFYEFTDVNPGDYYIEFNAPLDYDITFPNNNNNNNNDSDVDNSNGFHTTPLFNIANGENDDSWDAGFFKCVPLGDLVWFDLNENDIWDSVENGVNGLKVNAYRQGFDGDFFLYDYTFTGPNTDTPSDDGFFKFCVPPGTYYLEFVSPPVGLVNAQPNRGNDDEIDSDVTGAFGPGTTNSMTFMSGDTECSIGSGYYPMGTIGDFVFIDQNQNGIRENNEPGLGDVFVEAYNYEGEVVGTANSNEDGQYVIEYLQQEDVYLKFYTNSSFATTAPHIGDDSTDSDIDHSNGFMTTKWINVTAGEHQANIDAGFVLGTVAVDWVSFDGRQIGNHNALNWIVANEINASHYIVERSLTTGADFEEIEKVDATQVSADNASYDFEDFDIATSGDYYYRVKMVDTNGEYNYTNIIVINVENSVRLNAHVSVYPNPLVDEFTIDLALSNDQANVSYQLYNATGQLIRDVQSLASNLSSGKHQFLIDASTLTEGVYNLSVQTEGASFTKKLIVLK